MTKLLPVIVLLCSPLLAGDDSLAVWAEGREKVRPACERFIKKFAGVGAEPRWRKKILARAAQRITDKGGASNEAAEIQAMALDWASDNENALRSRDRLAMLEACFWTLLFIDRDVPPPPAMRDRVTRSNFETMSVELDQAVADAEKNGGKP